MNLKPLANNVIVKALKKEDVTKSGIVLPDSSDAKPEKGEVIAVGPGRILDNGQLAAMNVKVGDKVIFKKYSPDEVKVDDEEYLVLSETDIIAIIE
ncbi:MAG: co-chaperone GroES [Patescibacteria group bacterium]